MQLIPQCKPRRSRRAPRRTARQASPAARALILTIPQTQCRTPEGSSRMPTRTTDLNRFPFSNFKYFLTLFSKFFSSFPHGTCSLSVSRQYLALDGIYHPFRAAFPSNSTRRKRVIDDTCSQRQTGFSPSLIPCSNGLTPGPCRTAASVDYNSHANLIARDFQFELFPLHSPLLRESLLVSFPPLSYMLKSSGSSYLISDPELNGGDKRTKALGDRAAVE